VCVCVCVVCVCVCVCFYVCMCVCTCVCICVCVCVCVCALCVVLGARCVDLKGHKGSITAVKATREGVLVTGAYDACLGV